MYKYARVLILFKWVVGQVGCRTSGLSDKWVVRQVGCRTSGLSDKWVVGQGVPDEWVYTYMKRFVGEVGCPTCGLSDKCVDSFILRSTIHKIKVGECIML